MRDMVKYICKHHAQKAHLADKWIIKLIKCSLWKNPYNGIGLIEKINMHDLNCLLNMHNVNRKLDTYVQHDVKNARKGRQLYGLISPFDVINR